MWIRQYVFQLIKNKMLGVSGKRADLKNYFQNPYDETRKVFILCDAPHTVKNIRNRLYQNKYFKVNNIRIFNLNI